MEFYIVKESLHNMLAGMFAAREWPLSVLYQTESAARAVLFFVFVYFFGFYIYLWEKHIIMVLEKEKSGMKWFKTVVAGFFKAAYNSAVMLFNGEILPRFAGKLLYGLIASCIFVCLYSINMFIPFGLKSIAVDSANSVIFVLPLVFIVGMLRVLTLKIEEQNASNGRFTSGEIVFSGQAALTLAVLPVCFLARSYSFSEIAGFQAGANMSFIPGWFVFYPVLGQISFAVYVVSLVFIYDLGLEGSLPGLCRNNAVESLKKEIYSGYGNPYVFMWLNRYIFIFTFSGLGVVLFLGGGAGPFLSSNMWFMIKLMCVAAVFLLTGMKFSVIGRSDLMKLYWRGVMPLSMFNLALTCGIIYLS